VVKVYFFNQYYVGITNIFYFIFMISNEGRREILGTMVVPKPLCKLYLETLDSFRYISGLM
jgi:hypothetical protein